jgi:hypothetical protein
MGDVSHPNLSPIFLPTRYFIPIYIGSHDHRIPRVQLSRCLQKCYYQRKCGLLCNSSVLSRHHIWSAYLFLPRCMQRGYHYWGCQMHRCSSVSSCQYHRCALMLVSRFLQRGNHHGQCPVHSYTRMLFGKDSRVTIML